MEYPTPGDAMMKQFVTMLTTFHAPQHRALLHYPDCRPDHWNSHPYAIYDLGPV